MSNEKSTDWLKYFGFDVEMSVYIETIESKRKKLLKVNRRCDFKGTFVLITSLVQIVISLVSQNDFHQYSF